VTLIIERRKKKEDEQKKRIESDRGVQVTRID